MKKLTIMVLISILVLSCKHKKIHVGEIDYKTMYQSMDMYVVTTKGKDTLYWYTSNADPTGFYSTENLYRKFNP